MRVLLDTCVVSELRRRDADPRVARAVAAVAGDDAFLSALTLGAPVKGVPLFNAVARRRPFLAWVRRLERDYPDRILGVDAETARYWGELTAAAQRHGRTVGAVDGLMAATALRHGLRVMTRNVSDFEPTGVSLLNPWTD